MPAPADMKLIPLFALLALLTTTPLAAAGIGGTVVTGGDAGGFHAGAGVSVTGLPTGTEVNETAYVDVGHGSLASVHREANGCEGLQTNHSGCERAQPDERVASVPDPGVPAEAWKALGTAWVATVQAAGQAWGTATHTVDQAWDAGTCVVRETWALVWGGPRPSCL